jgi:hypothetical protein
MLPFGCLLRTEGAPFGDIPPPKHPLLRLARTLLKGRAEVFVKTLVGMSCLGIWLMACGTGSGSLAGAGVQSARAKNYAAEGDGLWPLAEAAQWSLVSGRESRTIQVVDQDSDGRFAVTGLFKERRWLRETSSGIMLTLDDGSESTFIRTDLDIDVDTTWEARVGTGICDKWLGRLTDASATITTEAGEFVHVRMYQFTPQPPDEARERCPAPEVWALSLAPGVGPVELTASFGSPPMQLNAWSVAR